MKKEAVFCLIKNPWVLLKPPIIANFCVIYHEDQHKIEVTYTIFHPFSSIFMIMDRSSGMFFPLFSDRLDDWFPETSRDDVSGVELSDVFLVSNPDPSPTKGKTLIGEKSRLVKYNNLAFGPFKTGCSNGLHFLQSFK